MVTLPPTIKHVLWTMTWHRRLLAAGLAAGAVALGIEAATPEEPELVQVTVAAHDIAGGSVVVADDLTKAGYPPDLVPDGTLEGADVIGRTLAAPARAGETLTDRRLVGPDLLSGWGPGLVATPIRLADPEAVAFLGSGDRIDVLATRFDGTGTVAVTEGTPVLAVPSAPEHAPAAGDGALVLVAVPPPDAARLADAAATARLWFTFSDPISPGHGFDGPSP